MKLILYKKQYYLIEEKDFKEFETLYTDWVFVNPTNCNGNVCYDNPYKLKFLNFLSEKAKPIECKEY